MSKLQQTNRTDEPERVLQRAYQEALAFLPSRANALAITPPQASEYAEQEAAFHTIAIDENGMSSGMRLNLLQPLHDLASEWRGLWNNFEIAIQPKITDINAVQKLHAEAAEERRKKDEALEAAERELRQDPKYDQIDDHHGRSKDLYDSFRDKHGNRNAVMFAKSPLYWCLLSLVLLTECFINYHAFNMFWGVPAVAFGCTVVLGVLLALASHGYGEILKQWSFRFGPDRDPAMRWTDWRMFSMSTAALAIVLAFTGWARWAAAIDMLGSQAQPSALGSIGVVQVNPLRDVLVSLIANLGAWMVGVIISYLAHDPDPDYMSATRQFLIARKTWNRARAAHSVRLKHIEARAAKAIEEKTKAAETRQKAVTREMDMLKQVMSRGEAVQRELEQVMTRNVETYRDALVRLALARQGKVQLVRAGTNTLFSPFDYKAMRIAPPQLLTRTAA
jgi:hypothetical protein